MRPEQLAPLDAEQEVVRRRTSAPTADTAAPAPRSGSLVVGAADDVAEHEADQVADLVVRTLVSPDPPRVATGDESARIHRSATVRRAPPASAGAIGADGGHVDADTSRKIQAAAGGTAMAEPVQRSMERAFGADFSDVRVHSGPESRELNDRIQASAFTARNHIWFRDGVPDTTNPGGQHLMAHELAHVVQQRGGAGGEAQRTIRRKYLDEKDWVKSTKNTGFFSGNRRSKEMKVIDDAVTQWDTAYFDGSVSGMVAGSQAILNAIALWESSKKNASAAMRGAPVGELKAEATMWNTKTSNWLAAFPERRAQHLADRAQLNTWIDEGLTQDSDQRLRNACQWVRSGKMRLYVVTETPDSIDRGARLLKKKVADMDADTLCYFPNSRKAFGDLSDPTPALYNADDLTDVTNVDVDEEGVGTKGWNSTGVSIVITEEGIQDGRAAVWGTLKHEVQHDADQHQGAELGAGVAAATTQEEKTSQEALQGYKTEYRAHFYEGDPKFESETHDDGDRIRKQGLSWTRRQYKIFKSIYDNYGYVEDAWGDKTGATPVTPTQLAFRNAVSAYWNPDTEGFNKYDSVRIDDLYKALQQIPAGTTDSAAAGMDVLLAAARQLDDADVRYIRDQNESVMLSAKITRHLAGAALAAFHDALDDALTGAVADWLESIFG